MYISLYQSMIFMDFGLESLSACDPMKVHLEKVTSEEASQEIE